MTMQLYHYTNAPNALLIGLGRGLSARLGEHNNSDGGQTMGVPVVWLTREQSNCATAEHVAYLAEHGIAHKLGEPMYGGPVRCIVEIERSKHVMRYGEFLQTTKIVGINPQTGERVTGRDLARGYAKLPGALTHWWISTRDIPVSKICVPLTRAQGIEACEWQVTHEDDPEARASWQRQRDAFAEQPDNARFLFNNGECQTFEVGEAA
jgi:hypothetical protein